MELPDLRIIDFIDILLVAGITYYIYRLVKGTAAINIFIGIVIIYVIYSITVSLEMELLSRALGAFTDAGVFALIVVFQQEIRRFLLMLGSTNITSGKGIIKQLTFFKQQDETDYAAVDQIARACKHMASSYTGALIIIKRDASLDFIKKTGDEHDIKVNAPIIESIFFKNSPLHDGAMIVEGNRITATRVILPVSENVKIPQRFGLRHRAAVGITERSNALAIVVSEETGQISLIHNTHFESIENHEALAIRLKNLLI